MANIVSIRYANALFNVAREIDSLDKIGDDFKLVVDLVNKEENLKQFINHPQVTNEDKKNVLKELVEGRISKELINFLYILIDKKRFKNIQEICNVFIQKTNEEKNLAVVNVKTATDLTENHLKAIKNTISKKINKNIELNVEKDKSIIGGLVLRIGDRVIDGSISYQLKTLEKELKRTKVS